MNDNLKQLWMKKKKLFLVTLLLFCVVSLCLGVYLYKKYAKTPTNNQTQTANNLQEVNQDLMRVAFPKELSQLCPLYPLGAHNADPSEQGFHKNIYKLLTQPFFKEKMENENSVFLPNLVVSVKSCNEEQQQEHIMGNSEQVQAAKTVLSENYLFELKQGLKFENDEEINCDVV
ncbi:putative effector [Maize bushy stunt phytoplasma]|uniref:Effector n=1 Tax=Maize bushy stunt phytoplasma TaxID=202462 RepID=A0ABM6DL91_9MOLU|nr:hypothetical protein [Maize bushy stunt phytoplasma]AOF54595.1 putative effector [Maize bushy stunt phytoplasma]